MTESFRKTCKVCGKSKPRVGFARNSDNPDGLRSICKKCNAKLAGVEKSRKETISRGVRRRVKDRAAGHCEMCGTSGPLELHHMNPVCLRPDLANSAGNLKALCTSCHKKQHSVPGMTHRDLAMKREALRPRHVVEVKF